MGAQSISNLAGASQNSLQIRLAVPFASAALADALSATARGQRDPLSAGARTLRSDFSSRRTTLNAENDRATTSLLQLGVAKSAFVGLVDTLEELEQLASSAAATTDTATRGNLNAAFQASLRSIMNDFSAAQNITGDVFARATRSNANGFTVAGLNVLSGGVTDVATSSIRVLSSRGEIPQAGLEFTFQVVNDGSASNTPGTFTTFNRTGSRGVLNNVVRNFNGSGALNQDIAFDVAGTKGTVSFAFAAGSTREAILDAINAATDSTGVDGFVDATGNIDLYSSEYGAGHDVLVSQLLDGASNHVAAGFDQGQNARLLVTDLQTGDTADVEGDGRRLAFTLSGIDFEIDLNTDKSAAGVSLLADSNALTSGGAVRAFHVARGGIQIGKSNAFFSLPELEMSSLGGKSGRLLTAEIVNNPNAALRVIQEVRNQVVTPLTRIAQAETSINETLTSNAFEITELEDSVTNIESLAGLIASFASVRQDADRQSAFALLSQISSFFPSSILPLLDAQR